MHLDPAQLVEEEKTPQYSPRRFFPTRLGQTLNGRYQVVTKLGYGSSSTVWLARDLYRWRWFQERYVAIKINATRHSSAKKLAKDELAVLGHIAWANPRHEGWHFVRKLVDSFVVDGEREKHQCLVFDPLREPLWLYCRRFTGAVIPPQILKIIVQMVLQGLDYLHTECHVIHADLKPDNVMVKVEDPSILERDARDEHGHPLPQKHIHGRVIYLSRNNYGQPSVATGVVQITDFDLSVTGDVPQTGCIQAEIYRAPEAVLDAGYGYSADIWSLGVMLWDLLEGTKLFEYASRDQPTSEYDDQTHLAHITALLGPAPSDLLAAGRRTSKFYTPDGNLKNPKLIPADFSFENTLTHVSGEGKRRFIDFVRKMIAWRPEDRMTARELLKDPWLHKDFPQG